MHEVEGLKEAEEQRKINKIATLAGTGEKVYTRTLCVLLEDQRSRGVLFSILNRCTPGLDLISSFSNLGISREKRLQGAWYPLLDSPVVDDLTFCFGLPTPHILETHWE